MSDIPRPHDDEEPKAADASWLEREDTLAAGPGDQPAEAAEREATSGEYDLLGEDLSSDRSAPDESIPLPPRASRPAPSVPPTDAARPEGARAGAGVDHVWTRWGEWWPTILQLLVTALVVLGLVYATFDFQDVTPSLVILLVGGVIALLLSYPIVITLERPVRATPEQAVKDYFGSLCHHLPHYRRMWLLLSAQGKVSGEYGSFDEFRSYWKRRLAELRGTRVSSWTPLVFLIEDFKAEKSGGLTEIDARYTVRVLVRGCRGEGPIESFPCEISLVRGPDRMWYLNQGTLPP